MLRDRSPLFSLFSLVLFGCVLGAPDLTQASPGRESAARAVVTGAVCPAYPALNRAPGSQRRCYDTQSGSLVQLACCSEICAAADWIETGIGLQCVFVEDPIQTRWKKGWYAPRVCCELNDRSAPPAAGPCALGERFVELFAQPSIVVDSDRRLVRADLPTLDSQQTDQIIQAVRQSAYDDVQTIEEAFQAVDAGEIRELRFFEGSRGQYLVAYEFGAGDNSYGAVFDSQSGELVARILDGDFYDGSAPPRLGCGLPRGPYFADCGSDADCTGAERCNGLTALPDGRTIGRCAQALGEDLPSSGSRCETSAQCDPSAGLLCLGREQSGFCRPAWMARTFSNPSIVEVAPSTSVRSTIEVYGLATVPEDLVLSLLVQHRNPGRLRIRLLGPAGEDGTVITVFDGRQGPGVTRNGSELRVAGQQPHSGDESVNGVWTLIVENLDRTASATLSGLALRASSRWD